MVHCYREWPPGDGNVPGVGMMEPWAVKSSRRGGVNDGARGEGTRKLDWGFLRYKFEIARLERWEDWRRWEGSGRGTIMDGGWRYPDTDELRAWSDADGSADGVAARIVDGRAAERSQQGFLEDKKLIDCLNELGMCWAPASGERIGSGEERIVNALEFRRDEAGVIVKPPELTFSAGCPNHIFAMENYNGADGQKGACKEPVDCLRYLYMSGMAEQDVNVLVMDYAPERNWFMGWYRCGNPKKAAEERARRQADAGSAWGRGWSWRMKR